MSAITEAEFVLACVSATRQSRLAEMTVGDTVKLVRTFFAALPTDVKLMKRDVTSAMLEAAEQRDYDEPSDDFGDPVRASFDAIFKAMFDAASSSLPEGDLQ